MYELPQLGHAKRVELERIYRICIHLTLLGAYRLAQTGLRSHLPFLVKVSSLRPSLCRIGRVRLRRENQAL